MTPLRLEAPAKLNLWLAVTGRRADGMHELVSDLVLLELADRLLLMPGCSGLRIEGSTAEGVPVGAGNLAWRGLQAGLGHAPELECLTLEKRIPVAAGLGGGSSDAAAAWRLGRHWEARPAEDPAVLADIGADVPFFAAAVAAARVRGIGEVVEPQEAPPALHAVLVHPPFALSTAAVFAELRESDWSRAPDRGRNDLLAPARRLRPALDDIVRQVAGAGGQPSLTGSGPTVYTLTDDPERAAAVAGRVERAGLRATLTRLRSEAASIQLVGDDAEEQE
ncbi:MAG TPA: 4-(cytidine 5'-diphospho)-2-C-methyl-D-erythritol kinase [Candidatus Limnocylindria bacterium]|nr:4-(cytidine 5'-diphospho)-2-C-methyl-D-erythritol kinase [Candidatus Limnocylindria bacterium]